ncbi:hypothetical protein IPF37_04280 [bacterium]|nr:MAG: hypothetical protein IPF37_04280 [bacterium]
MRDLCEELNIKNKTHVKAVCDGKRSHVETYRVAYYDNEKNEPSLTKRHNEKSSKIIRKIQCLDDKEIFDNCTEAGKKYSIEPGQIGLCARGVLKSARWENPITGKKERLRFAYLDASGKPIIKQKHNESLMQRQGIPKIELTNPATIEYLGKSTFDSLAEYCREMGVPAKRARKYLNNLIDKDQMDGCEFVEVGTRAVRRKEKDMKKKISTILEWLWWFIDLFNNRNATKSQRFEMNIKNHGTIIGDINIGNNNDQNVGSLTTLKDMKSFAALEHAFSEASGIWIIGSICDIKRASQKDAGCCTSIKNIFKNLTINMEYAQLAKFQAIEESALVAIKNLSESHDQESRDHFLKTWRDLASQIQNLKSDLAIVL